MTALYTVAEAAALTKQHPHTIYRLIKSGVIPCYRPNGIRGTIRIAESDLRNYMQSGRIASNAELKEVANA